MLAQAIVCIDLALRKGSAVCRHLEASEGLKSSLTSSRVVCHSLLYIQKLSSVSFERITKTTESVDGFAMVNLPARSLFTEHALTWQQRDSALVTASSLTCFDACLSSRHKASGLCYSKLPNLLPHQPTYIPSIHSVFTPSIIMARTDTAIQLETCECLNYDFTYANEPKVPCACEGCADYESDAGYISSDYSEYSGTSGADTDYVHTTDVLEQAQPFQLNDRRSVADLNSLLEEQCPGEYAALPEATTFKIEDWHDGCAQKRLRIGAIRTPLDIVGSTVYAFIRGDDSNRTGLSQGPKSEPLPLKDANDVDLAEPFRSICWTGRLVENVEKRRLRALLCFWFFSAGHLSNFKKYRDFEKHLVEAVQWLGRAMIEQQASNSNEALSRSDLDTSMREPFIPAAEHPSAATKRNRPPVQEQSQAETVDSEHYFNFESQDLTSS